MQVNLQPKIRVMHTLNGNEVYLKDQSEKDYLKASYLVDEYYKNQLNKNWGISELVAVFECLSGVLLGICMPSPATITNALTSFSEFGQVLVGRTRIFGDTTPPDENVLEEVKLKAEERIKKAESRREGTMAWMQLIAGGLGGASRGMDYLFPKDHDVSELSLWKKIPLSIASFTSAVAMFFGFGEKTTMSTIGKKGSESVSMRMNGMSDLRCFIEWSAMTIFPWVKGTSGFLKKIEKAIDTVIPLMALREGLGSFMRTGISPIFNENEPKQLGDYIGKPLYNLFKGIFFINDDKKNKVKNDSVFWPFSTKWFLGTKDITGFRTKYLIPLLRVFGCNPPVSYLKSDNKGNWNIISEFYEKPQSQLQVNLLPRIDPPNNHYTQKRSLQTA